ncbi:PREDICTED: uncharacterized protein LOC109317439 [Crocodylus porosus]|uniref:uncharacterized protein LOC109317439 n=1 Tax=Crocodylus porosus TaxID=8502 RepID=UPI00093C599E|nr:PREDICTED: uncharacterized protein LOC109317439 [Crocodylus porosus]
MAALRAMWRVVRNVLCCQSTEDAAVEPQKKEQLRPTVSDVPVYSDHSRPEVPEPPIQTTTSFQLDRPFPSAQLDPETRDTASQGLSTPDPGCLHDLAEELRCSQSWTRELLSCVNDLEQLLGPAVEQRSSVQPSQSEELQIDLERSPVQEPEPELECRVVRARQIICDIQRKVVILHNRLQDLASSFPASRYGAVPVHLALPPSSVLSPPVPPTPLLSSAVWHLFPKIPKKSAIKPAAETSPQQKKEAHGEPLSPRQNLMKEMLETIRQGVSLKPVCLSREDVTSQVQDASSLEHEPESLSKERSSETAAPLDSYSSPAGSSQTHQPLGRSILRSNSAASTGLPAALAHSEDGCPDRTREKPGRRSPDDDNKGTSALLETTPQREGGHLKEENSSSSPASLDTICQTLEDAEAMDSSTSPSSQNHQAVEEKSCKDEPHAQAVMAGEMCEEMQSEAPASVMAKPLGEGSGEVDHGAGRGPPKIAELNGCKDLSLHISCSKADLLEDDRGQDTHVAVVVSCLDEADAPNRSAEQTLPARECPSPLVSTGTPGAQPALNPLVACDVEPNTPPEGGDLAKGEPVLPAASHAALERSSPEGAEMVLEGGAGVSASTEQSSSLKDSAAAMALLLPGAKGQPPAEMQLTAVPDLLLEAGPVASSDSKMNPVVLGSP